MIFCIALVFIILLEGLLISISLIKLNDNYLKGFYGGYEAEYSKDIYFYVLIPVFNESCIIKETYEHFQKILCKYNSVECYFITTEKENVVYGKNRTKDILEECVSNDKFHIVHYPYVTGNKPSQLNYCLDLLKEKIDSTEKSIYICQYDADSRPDINTFDDIANIISKTKARVIQQQTKYNQNYSQLGLYMRMEACFQTRWAYGFERRNQFFSINEVIKKFFVPYAYCVGHGMVVESKLLYSMGKYPTPSEDVPFGFKMMLINETIYPAITNDTSSVTTRIGDLINQSGNWIKAPLLAVKMYKEVKEIKDISVFRTVLFFIKVIFDFLSWIQGLVLVIILITISVEKMTIIPFVVAYLILFIEATPGIYYTHKYIFKEKSVLERIFMALISPFRSIIRGLGVFSFLKQMLFGWYYDVGRKE